MALQTFHTALRGEGEHQTRLTALVLDGEPWFKGVEVASALGYKNTQLAVRVHVEDDDKTTLGKLDLSETLPSLSGNEGATIFISESGLYSLIMKSKLPRAVEFKRWVTKEVLPTIRRTGAYRAQSTSEEIEPPHPPSETQIWELKRARLDALRSSFELAQAVGIQLGDTQRKAIEDAVRDTLLPIREEQVVLVDAAELLRRKGHTPQEVARLSCEFGKALKTACTRTGRVEHPTGDREFGAFVKSVRMYHPRLDAQFTDAVYRIFAQSELYRRVCHSEDDSSCETARSVESALKDTRWTTPSRERSCRRRSVS